MTYFRGIKAPGEEERRGSHEDLAEEIAIAGTTWSENFWRREDMDAYTLRYATYPITISALFLPLIICLVSLLVRLMLEYARVMSDDREAMSFVYDESIHVDPVLPTHE